MLLWCLSDDKPVVYHNKTAKQNSVHVAPLIIIFYSHVKIVEKCHYEYVTWAYLSNRQDLLRHCPESERIHYNIRCQARFFATFFFNNSFTIPFQICPVPRLFTPLVFLPSLVVCWSLFTAPSACDTVTPDPWSCDLCDFWSSFSADYVDIFNNNKFSWKVYPITDDLWQCLSTASSCL